MQESVSSTSLADPDGSSSVHATTSDDAASSASGGYIVKGNVYQGTPANQWRHASLQQLMLQHQQLQQQQQQQHSRRTSEALEAADGGFGPESTPVSATLPVSGRVKLLQESLSRLKRRPLLTSPTASSVGTARGFESLPVLGAEFADSEDSPSSLPGTFDEALQRHAGEGSGKSLAITCMEADGKTGRTLTYAKLYSSSRRLAYYLLNKVGHKGSSSLKPGDRAALLLPASDVCTLATAFAACQLAGVVPVPVEPPPTATAETGQMLAALEARAVLTSESFYRQLKTQSQHEPPSYPGWPSGLHWILADAQGLTKPAKDWRPPQSGQQSQQQPLAYAECGPARDGSARAVCISRVALLSHGKALCSALGYGKGDTAVCLLDPRRDVGLWHGLVASMLAGLHVYFVPYSLMKSDSLAWLRLVAKQRVAYAWAKSRDLYWSLLAGKDESSTSGMSLASLRCLLVADSINPWSLTSCDSFLTCFRSRGLSPNCLVTCAYSPESLTVSLRRPGYSVGRGVVSMHGLSYGLVQVDSDSSYTSLTLQDCGHLLPQSAVAVVRLGRQGATESRPQLCRVDEVGEICVCSRYSAARYAGNDSPNERVFNCRPVSATGDEIDSAGSGTDGAFVRTGLIGFLGPPTSGGLLFVCGTIATQLCVAKRRHSAEDIIATVLAVEPLKFVYRGRIAVFAQPLLGDDRIVVVAEQRPDASDSRCHTWACHVLQAMESIHQLSVYCLALVPANSLPRGPHGSVETVTVRDLYSAGRLRPCRVLMCPQAAVADQLQLLIDDANNPTSDIDNNSDDSKSVESIEPSVSDRSSTSSSSAGPTLPCLTLTDALRWRASREPDTRLLSVCTDASSASDTDGDSSADTVDIVASCSVGEPLTAQGLLKRADRVASLIRTGLQLTAQQQALVSPIVAVAAAPGPDLLAGLFGAMLAGCVPAVMRPPAPAPSSLSAFARLVRAADCVGVVSSQPVAKLLKAKSSQPNLRPPLPPLLELDKAKKVAEKAAASDSGDPNSKLASQTDPESAAYLDLCGAGSPQDDSLQTPGSSAPIGVRVTHRAAMAACQCLQTRCDLQLGRDLPACVDLYSGGMAFIVACLASVACGHHTLLMPAGALSLEPSASGAAGFLQMLAQRSVRDALCGYELLDRCCARLQPESVKQKHSLANLRSLIVLGTDRPRAELLAKFGRLLVPLGLSPTALRCSFGCRVNPCLTLPATDVDADSAAIYADARALRQDRLVSVDSDSPNAVALLQAGQPAPDARISLATPSVRGGDVGEILVRSRGNVEPLTAATAAAGLSARTGYLGVIRQVDSGPAPALFVIGAVADCLTGLSGCCSTGGGTSLRYYPADLEATVVRCHPAIVDCAVFACDSLLAVVMELSCRESDALDAVPQATTALLRDHQLVASVLIVCDPGAIPANGRGEKLRSVLRDRFLSDRLDPVYVAYNL
ncbi:hypothetical protein BOX15_Mlig027150g1 [Macrostomum lignano]|uniref:AMP-dependent synthetase/ligase domain-containing protein n=2 Tax=Macrostomum lignano TaxID=282301 RepID=A0A267FNQ2_9PLAT|nr:hypothetical protein BOX15_Mlig027150g1 [Macrostomum lignano]